MARWSISILATVWFLLDAVARLDGLSNDIFHDRFLMLFIGAAILWEIHAVKGNRE